MPEYQILLSVISPFGVIPEYKEFSAFLSFGRFGSSKIQLEIDRNCLIDLQYFFKGNVLIIAEIPLANPLIEKTTTRIFDGYRQRIGRTEHQHFIQCQSNPCTLWNFVR